MTKPVLDRIEGRRAFGADPENYDSARPGYPARVFEVLRERCGLGATSRVFEIGAGTGLATRPMLEVGLRSLLAVEPDERLANLLQKRTTDPRLTVVIKPFEDAELPMDAFDLGASATAFHWLEQRPTLTKVASLLRPGGWWAAWWNVFGDPERSDPFHEATEGLLSDLSVTPSQPDNSQHPFGLDTEARTADLAAVGAFVDIGWEIMRWTLVLDPAQVRALYASYSHFSVLGDAERNRLLDGLFEIAEREFGGRVERNMCTAIYTAQRV